MEKKHYSLSQIARHRAMNNSGYKAPSVDNATDMANQLSLVEGTLLELVRRLNQAIRAWSTDKDADDEISQSERPSYAVPAPDLNIGDVVYYCSDLDDGCRKHVIVAKDDEGYCRSTMLDIEMDAKQTYLCWVDDGDARTEAEAVLKEAKSDIEYYGRRLRQAQQVVDAIENGKPFAEFLGEISDDDESVP